MNDLEEKTNPNIMVTPANRKEMKGDTNQELKDRKLSKGRSCSRQNLKPRQNIATSPRTCTKSSRNAQTRLRDRRHKDFTLDFDTHYEDSYNLEADKSLPDLKKTKSINKNKATKSSKDFTTYNMYTSNGFKLSSFTASEPSREQNDYEKPKLEKK